MVAKCAPVWSLRNVECACRMQVKLNLNMIFLFPGRALSCFDSDLVLTSSTSSTIAGRYMLRLRTHLRACRPTTADRDLITIPRMFHDRCSVGDDSLAGDCRRRGRPPSPSPALSPSLSSSLSPSSSPPSSTCRSVCLPALVVFITCNNCGNCHVGCCQS